MKNFLSFLVVLTLALGTVDGAIYLIIAFAADDWYWVPHFLAWRDSVMSIDLPIRLVFAIAFVFINFFTLSCVIDACEVKPKPEKQ